MAQDVFNKTHEYKGSKKSNDGPDLKKTTSQMNQLDKALQGFERTLMSVQDSIGDIREAFLDITESMNDVTGGASDFVRMAKQGSEELSGVMKRMEDSSKELRNLNRERMTKAAEYAEAVQNNDKEEAKKLKKELQDLNNKVSAKEKTLEHTKELMQNVLKSDEEKSDELRTIFSQRDTGTSGGRALDKFDKGLGFLKDIKDGNLDLKKTLMQGLSAINNMIDRAADILSQGFGQVDAALYGSGVKFQDLVDNLDYLGFSPLVKQTEVLQNLTKIATQGISKDIETLGLLETIKDKTVASFDATDSNLRRLVLLNQNLGNLSAKQFGLAATLRTELNNVFGDSSYMAKMFQSLTGTLIDAVSANALKGSTDSTNFYAVMETFAGGMYEAGVDEGTVNAIAQGINYLGSGNISALSGNKALQNLLLLSADRAGLDYASVLQQGLSATDTYKLLSEIIDYLADITNNTSQNNVLQSSYANLFNLSIADMTALKNWRDTNYSKFDSYARASTGFTGNQALAATYSEINSVAERTALVEKMNNVFDNVQFILGKGVANSSWAYTTNLVSRGVISAGQALSEMGLSIAGKVTKMAGAIGYGISMIPGFVSAFKNAKASLRAAGADKTTVGNYYIATLDGTSGGIYDSTKTYKAPNETESFKGFDKTINDEWGEGQEQQKLSEENTQAWKEAQEESEQDPNTKILKEFEKTLMKANEGEGYAFAVSLQGMSDGVLRSFASIFADEEAMMETLTGKNNALEQNNTFINYAEDKSVASGATNIFTQVEKLVGV